MMQLILMLWHAFQPLCPEWIESVQVAAAILKKNRMLDVQYLLKCDIFLVLDMYS